MEMDMAMAMVTVMVMVEQAMVAAIMLKTNGECFPASEKFLKVSINGRQLIVFILITWNINSSFINVTEE